ncbi:hypothetical protein L209DRAFT_182822 [Thermothelomyces heterothallicus CBS 203.75]
MLRFLMTCHTSIPSHESGPVSAHRPPPVRSFGTPSGPQPTLGIHPGPAHPCGPVVACRFCSASEPCGWPPLLPLPCLFGWPGPEWNRALPLVCLELTDFLPLPASSVGRCRNRSISTFSSAFPKRCPACR